MQNRTAFYISDRTGITAETVGQSLVSQFDRVAFQEVTLAFVDSEAKIAIAHEKIKRAKQLDGESPIVISSMVNHDLRNQLKSCDALVIDIFEAFIPDLVKALGVPSAYAVGRSHAYGGQARYQLRIDALNFSLDQDDGANTNRYEEADIVVIGVSRSGKTPTCLFLAMQYGLKAANYPLTPDDLHHDQLPAPLRKIKHKLFGLTIAPKRLHLIRSERQPGTRYATLNQCLGETRQAEAIYAHHSIPYLNSTQMSIEEIASTILSQMDLTRKW